VRNSGSSIDPGAMNSRPIGSPHVLGDLRDESGVGLGRQGDVMVGSADTPGVGVDDDQAVHTVGVGRREQDRQGSTVGCGDHRRPFDPCSIHHGLEVVFALLDPRKVGGGDAIRQAHSALVEHREPAERCEPLVEVCELGVLPSVLEVGSESGDHHEVDRAVAHHLICDADASTVGVARFRDRGMGMDVVIG